MLLVLVAGVATGAVMVVLSRCVVFFTFFSKSGRHHYKCCRVTCHLPFPV